MRNTHLISYQILHPKLLWQRLCKPHILKSFQILQQSKNCSRQHHFPTINGKEYKKENELSIKQLYSDIRQIIFLISNFIIDIDYSMRDTIAIIC